MKTLFVFLLSVCAFVAQAQVATTVTSYSSINRSGLKYETKTVTTLAQPASESMITCKYVIDSTVANRTYTSQKCDTIPAKAAVPASHTTTETGRIVGLEVDASPNAAYATPHKSTLELLSLTYENDQELILTVQRNYYTPDGRPMTDAIQADTTLSPDAKRQALRQFASFQLDPKRTRDSWVNPTTGAFVEKGTPGAVNENKFLQGLTTEHLIAMGLVKRGDKALLYPDLLVKLMLLYQMKSIEARTGI
jgi:hypothetical protein